MEVGSWPGWFIVLLSQPDFGEYRTDFALTSIHPEDHHSIPWLVIVEVDGHDYHERTKEQAARDKRRDRFFSTRGATVLRYTGSEIYRNADRCANEALWVAMRKQQVHLMPAFVRFMSERGAITGEQHQKILAHLGGNA